MTVTGILKSMQTRTYFAFWKQKTFKCLPNNIEAHHT